MTAEADLAGSASTPSAAAVVVRLTERRETLATAESLTGGLVGQLITAVPGASVAYRGGVIVYATTLKAVLAGVSEDTLSRLGPVAGPTAAEMAAGVAARCGADWGLATTGVAGPEPQDGHPIGLAYVAVHGPRAADRRTSELRLAGDRAVIRGQVAAAALDLLLDRLTA